MKVMGRERNERKLTLGMNKCAIVFVRKQMGKAALRTHKHKHTHTHTHAGIGKSRRHKKNALTAKE